MWPKMQEELKESLVFQLEKNNRCEKKKIKPECRDVETPSIFL